MSTKEKSGQARYGGNHGTESKTHREWKQQMGEEIGGEIEEMI